MKTFNSRHENSLVGREERFVDLSLLFPLEFLFFNRLEPVPNVHGHLPNEFPTNIMMLLVAGNEQLPDGSRNEWNNEKSKSLLKFYEVQVDDSDSEPESDEDETKQELRKVKKELKEYKSSRQRRLEVAKKIGVSRTQLNFAQLIL